LIKVRIFPLILILIFIHQSNCYSQNFEFKPFNKKLKNPAFTYIDGGIGVQFNRNFEATSDTYAYNTPEYQSRYIVAMYRENLNQDAVYYIDEHGNTEYVVFSSTSHVNQNQLIPKRDSFNPYGARTPLEGIATGILNVLIRYKSLIWK